MHHARRRNACDAIERTDLRHRRQDGERLRHGAASTGGGSAFNVNTGRDYGAIRIATNIALDRRVLVVVVLRGRRVYNMDSVSNWRRSPRKLCVTWRSGERHREERNDETQGQREPLPPRASPALPRGGGSRRHVAHRRTLPSASRFDKSATVSPLRRAHWAVDLRSFFDDFGRICSVRAIHRLGTPYAQCVRMMNQSYTMLRSILSVAACISLVQETTHKALKHEHDGKKPDEKKPN